MVVNSALIRKIYLRVSCSRRRRCGWLWYFVPQIAVMLACFLVGWSPTFLAFGSILAGMLIVMMLSYGLGLIFGVANVFFRDSENIVDMLLMVATWFSPVLYLDHDA